MVSDERSRGEGKPVSRVFEDRLYGVVHARRGLAFARVAAALGALGVLGVLGAASAAAQPNWPTRPMRVIVPVVPGSFTDVVGRALAAEITEASGQPALVDNRPGAGTTIGASLVAKSAPDGHTLLMTENSFSIAPALYRRTLPFDPIRDFQPVTLVAVDMLHVPYKGSGPVIQALLAGEVNSAFAALGPVLPHIRAGRLRALGIVDSARTGVLPELPTVAEAGPLPGFGLDSWLGLVVPSGTPRAIVERMSDALAKLVRMPDFAEEKLRRQSYDPIGSTPSQMAEVMRADVARYAKLVRDAKIPAE